MASCSDEVYELFCLYTRRKLASLFWKRIRKIFKTRKLPSQKGQTRLIHLMDKKLDLMPFPELLPSRKMRLLR